MNLRKSFLLCLFIASAQLAFAAANVADITGYWLGKLEVGTTTLRVGFRITQGPGNTLKATMDSLDQGARDIRVDTITFEQNTLRLEVKSVNGVYSGSLDPAGKKLTGKWQQGPATLPLLLERAAAKDQPPEYRLPAYARPASFKEADVVVGTNEWKLPGTLSLPVGKGPCPALVLVHGSGPNDRDESIGPNKPFRDLASGLASDGIVVVRYEKRSRHYASKIAASIAGFTPNEETITDALEAVTLLRKTAGVRSDKIFVLGHSLGGMLAPRIAQADPGVAGLILMAAPARPLEDLVLEQSLYQASLAGELSPDSKKRLDELKQQVAAIKKLTPASDPKTMLLAAPARYWLDLQGYKPAEVTKSLRQPMLILQGAKDCQVSAQADLELWRQALSSRKDVVFKTYPNFNHLFMSVDGKSKGQEYSKPGHVDETVVRDIAAWIKAH